MLSLFLMYTLTHNRSLSLSFLPFIPPGAAGAGAGAVEAFINCPFETVKVQMQAKENLNRFKVGGSKSTARGGLLRHKLSTVRISTELNICFIALILVTHTHSIHSICLRLFRVPVKLPLRFFLP